MSSSARSEYLAGLLKGLSHYTEQLESNDGAGYAANFQALKDSSAPRESRTSQLPMNIPKNRYRNIAAYDHSRVVLNPPSEGCDYINANWVDGFESPRKYIASQGPVPASIVDFWHMIWVTKSPVIIKVTREVEGDVLKCHRYWPDPESSPPQKLVLLGQIEVEHISTSIENCWFRRQFKLRKGTIERDVVQLSYEAWPDHGVPLTSREFLKFREAVKNEESKLPRGPSVIHCSAGVGRTGTYMVVDRVLDAVHAGKKSKDLDLDACIKDLRNQRCFMVQTVAQYRFCYNAVLDGIRAELESHNTDNLKSETKTFVQQDRQENLERSKQEDTDIASVIKKRAEKISTASLAEMEAAQAQWDKRKEDDYNVSMSLTDLESRFTSLAMSGMEIDLTPAHPQQIRNIVQQAKELDARKRQEQENMKLSKARQSQADLSLKCKLAADAEARDIKEKARKKASRFLKSGAR